MNTPDHDSPIPADEWQAQEQAMRAERSREPESGDMRVSEYRRIARVLGRPQPVTLPPDFARQVAQRALSESVRDTDTRIENGLATALMAMLGLAVLVLAVLQGPQWWQALTSLVPDATLSNRWLLSLLACAGGHLRARTRWRQTHVLEDGVQSAQIWNSEALNPLSSQRDGRLRVCDCVKLP